MCTWTAIVKPHDLYYKAVKLDRSFKIKSMPPDGGTLLHRHQLPLFDAEESGAIVARITVRFRLRRTTRHIMFGFIAPASTWTSRLLCARCVAWWRFNCCSSFKHVTADTVILSFKSQLKSWKQDLLCCNDTNKGTSGIFQLTLEVLLPRRSCS